MEVGWNPSNRFILICERRKKLTSRLRLVLLVEQRNISRRIPFYRAMKMLRCEYPNRSARKEDVLIIKNKTREWKGNFKKRTSKQVAYHRNHPAGPFLPKPWHWPPKHKPRHRCLPDIQVAIGAFFFLWKYGKNILTEKFLIITWGIYTSPTPSCPGVVLERD